jgi:hypothetical protein
MALSSDSTASRKFRKTGIPTSPIGRPRKTVGLNLFYRDPRPLLTRSGRWRATSLGEAKSLGLWYGCGERRSPAVGTGTGTGTLARGLRRHSLRGSEAGAGSREVRPRIHSMRRRM